MRIHSVEGEIAGREVEVIVEEPESNTKLCGPACANEVYVHDGSVLGVPDIEKWAKVRQEGVSTGITYLDAVSSLAAARIEEAARCGEGTHVQVKMSKLPPSDVNLRIEEYAMRYITDHNKKWISGGAGLPDGQVRHPGGAADSITLFSLPPGLSFFRRRTPYRPRCTFSRGGAARPAGRQVEPGPARSKPDLDRVASGGIASKRSSSVRSSPPMARMNSQAFRETQFSAALPLLMTLFLISMTLFPSMTPTLRFDVRCRRSSLRSFARCAPPSRGSVLR